MAVVAVWLFSHSTLQQKHVWFWAHSMIPFH
jgi:hypothetical protein